MTLFGPEELSQQILDPGLCTLCGACANICPYIKVHNNKIVTIFSCDRTEGRCYAHCPKVGALLDKMSQFYKAQSFTENPIGEYIKIIKARKGVKAPEGDFQDSGVVSSLIIFAMEKGLIDAALLTGKDGINPVPTVVNNRDGVLECAGSKYIASPVLSMMGQASDSGIEKLGIVGTPCQITALSQIRQNPLGLEEFKNNTALSIGLFCTWALDGEKFMKYLAPKKDIESIKSMDIPPPPAEKLIVKCEDSFMEFPLNEIRKLKLAGCGICPDMTSELSDISVGALEGFDGWNTLIIRSEKGEQLVSEAVDQGFIEIGTLPDKCFENLIRGAVNKREQAVKKCMELGMLDDDFKKAANLKDKQTITGVS